MLMENWLGPSLNQIQGWTTVRESYSHALEQGPLAPSLSLVVKKWKMLPLNISIPETSVNAKMKTCARPAIIRVLRCVDLWRIRNCVRHGQRGETGAENATTKARFSRTSWLRNLHSWVQYPAKWRVVVGCMFPPLSSFWPRGRVHAA